jgi:omega-6 fatty acid desaturase (delta-12 desaturase)
VVVDESLDPYVLPLPSFSAMSLSILSKFSLVSKHADTCMSYYSSETRFFLRGAASTIDRGFGFIGRNLFHGTIECHVLHHHATRIPFYHAAEATLAIKSVMGSHYQSDVKTPFLWAFWNNYNRCRFVEEKKDVGSEVYFFGKI